MNSFMIEAGRKRRATVTVEEQPGAHTGSTRKYIPQYADSEIIFRAPTTGSDAADGLTELTPKQTKSACDTAAGSTKKIRIIEACALSEDIEKPTEMKIGIAGSISGSQTSPVDTWMAAATPSYGGTGVRCLAYITHAGVYLSGGNSGKLANSPDGNTWTQLAGAGFGASTVNSIAYSENLRRAVVVGVGGAPGYVAYTDDGATFTHITSPFTLSPDVVIYSRYHKKFIAAGRYGEIFHSADGITWMPAKFNPLDKFAYPTNYAVRGMAVNDLTGRIVLIHTTAGASGSTKVKVYYADEPDTWTAATTTFTDSWDYFGITVNPSTGRFVMGGNTTTAGDFQYSDDGGDTWSQAATPSYGADGARAIFYDPELDALISTGNGGKSAYSTDDGNTWVQAATSGIAGGNGGGCIAKSTIGGRLIIGTYLGVIVYSSAYSATISASIAGFTVSRASFSGTISAYNCSLGKFGTTAALSTENCRFTASGSNVSNNAQKHMGLLVDGSVHFTTTPAAQNAFSLTRYTVAGAVYIHNASAKYFEEIKDGIVTDGIQADYTVVVESGNVRGTCTNVVFGIGISVADPAFVNETDYQLKREVNGYDEDSVCVAKSSYYYNSAGARRDIGAWSYKETNPFYIYERAYEMRKPSAKDSTAHTERQPEYLYWGEDMTPDVATDPDSRGEELVLNYRTLPIADVEFFRYLRSLKDRTVRIDYDPSWTPASTVTVDGDQSAGADVLVLLTSTLEAGQKLTISGKTYSVIRMSGTTKAVLNRSLQDAVTNGQTITVSDTSGKGLFQFTTDTDINLTRFYENNRAYLKGVKMKFVRKAE